MLDTLEQPEARFGDNAQANAMRCCSRACADAYAEMENLQGADASHGNGASCTTT